MESFEHDGLLLEVHTEGNIIKNYWKGKSRDLNPVQFLNGFFQKLIAYAKGKELIVDFCDLIIMNSSTIRLIVNLINQLHRESIPAKFIYNKNISWQAACFKPIKLISEEYPNIEIIPGT